MNVSIKKYLSSLFSSTKRKRESDRIAELEVRVRERDERISSLEREIAAFERTISEIRSSVSWRATAPIRIVIAWMQKLMRRAAVLPKARQERCSPSAKHAELSRPRLPKDTRLLSYMAPEQRLDASKRKAITRLIDAIIKDIRKEL